VYVPEAVNFIIVFEPEVVTVGLPVVVPVYKELGTDKITTPEPPADDPDAEAPLPPPPPPVFAVPADATLLFKLHDPLPPPPLPPVGIAVALSPLYTDPAPPPA
jgi:hypothetical protein